MDPLNCRFWFQLRTPVNIALSLVICAVLVVTLSFYTSAWLADVIAIGLTTYFFVVFLNKRSIRIRCEHCGKIILSNTPWICGFCHEENRNTDDFPFVHHCAHCLAAPKAYRCHHKDCGQLIYLTVDRLEENYAHCANIKNETLPPLRRDARDEEKLEKEHQLIIAELDRKLAAIKRQGEFVKPKTPMEEKEASLDRRFAAAMGAREAAMRKKAQIAEQYKSDSVARADAEKVVDDWLADNL